MKTETSKWCDLTSSSDDDDDDDDDDEDFLDSGPVQSSKQRTKRNTRTSSPAGSEASSAFPKKKRTNPGRHTKAKNHHRSGLLSPTTTKSAPSSRNNRKRFRTRPTSIGSGNPSDDDDDSSSSSSSSDDSFLFRNAPSLASRRTAASTVAAATNTRFQETKVQSPGAGDRCEGIPDANLSDSDDTAELVRQLTQPPKARRSPSRDCSREKNHRDREASVDWKDPPPMGSPCPNPTSVPALQARASSGVRIDDKNNEHQDSRWDPTTPSKNPYESPVRFQLPPPASSSEDSSSSEYSDDDGDEKEQQEPNGASELHRLESHDTLHNKTDGIHESEWQSTRQIARDVHDDNNNNSYDDCHSLSGGVTREDPNPHAETNYCRQVPQQESEHESEHYGRRHEQPLNSTAMMQSDGQLFGEAFVGTGSSSPNSRDNAPETEISHHRDLPVEANHTQGDLFYEEFSAEDPRSSSAHATHYTIRGQSQDQCIDLVDSEDEANQQYFTTSQGRVFLNEGSPRSPSRRRSPKFNIAARDFVHKKKPDNRSETAAYHYQEHNRSFHEETGLEDDVLPFEDDHDFQFSGRETTASRARRVTQDHSNQIRHHNTVDIHAEPPFRDQPRWNGQPLQQEGPLHRYPQPTNNLRGIPRPWPSTNTPAQATTRRVRDPAASNLSLAASVAAATSNRHRGNPYSASRLPGRHTSPPSTRNTTHESSSRTSQQQRSGSNNMGDIRTFLSTNKISSGLVQETRDRARAIESVRSNRHDIEGHANVTVIQPPSSPARRSNRYPRGNQNSNRTQQELEDDVIEVYDDESAQATSSTATRRTTSRASSSKPKATKRKRASTATRKTKTTRKATGGRKRTRGKSRFGKRGGAKGRRKRSGSQDSGGAWGANSSGGSGWASARPANREDPAFRNVGAEITF